jgi:hypothetical protein
MHLQIERGKFHILVIIDKGDCYLHHVCPSVRIELIGSHWRDLKKKVWYLSIFRKSVEKILSFVKIWQELGVLYVKMFVWPYVAEFFLEWEMFWTDVVEKNKIIRVIFSNFSFSEYCAFYAIFWKNMVELDRPQMTVWLMSFAFWITKVTNTH